MNSTTLYRNCLKCIFKEFRSFKSDYYVTGFKPYKRRREDVNEEAGEQYVNHMLTPLWKIPYHEQLQIKNEFVSFVITRYYSILLKHLSKPSAKRSPVLPPKPQISEILPSPVLYHYRTKDTYSVGTGFDGNPCVGHRLPTTLKHPNPEKTYVCLPPSSLISPLKHIQVGKAFQDYLRSRTAPENEVKWTQLQVRSSTQGDSMALVRINPWNLSQRQIEDECNRLTEFFKSGPGSVCQLTCLFFQASPFHKSNGGKGMAPYQLLLGNEHMFEKLCGYTFALSPGSFFQSNREVAEIMYKKIIASANLSPTTSVLDLGCGIGTISIILSPFVKETVGIDYINRAIQDAYLNASLNNIRTAHFMPGRIEKKLNLALQWLQPTSDVVAILNPGRSGVDVSLIYAMRESRQIRKVIFVACKPDHEYVARNILALIKPVGQKTQGPPFTFQSVIPLDMFPQTEHCEIVMVFER